MAFLAILGQLTEQAGFCSACCFFDSFPDAWCTVDTLLMNVLEKCFMPGNAQLPDNLKVDTFSLYLCININRISTATLVPNDLFLGSWAGKLEGSKRLFKALPEQVWNKWGVCLHHVTALKAIKDIATFFAVNLQRFSIVQQVKTKKKNKPTNN